MIEVRLFTLTAIAVLAVALFRYIPPFAACRNCPGRRCRRCRGLGRYERRGSRAVHRLAAVIRGELGRARAGRQSSPKGDR